MYATASYDDSVFIFGGYSQYDGRIQSTIAKYDGHWSKIGDLGLVQKSFLSIQRHLAVFEPFKLYHAINTLQFYQISRS